VINPAAINSIKEIISRRVMTTVNRIKETTTKETITKEVKTKASASLINPNAVLLM
jgi:hypothetical protein